MKSLSILLTALCGVLVACDGKIQGEKTFNYRGGEHQLGRITYHESPPVGGPHNAIWQNCGVYDQAIPNEYAVHSLEHGTVWITYQPNLAAIEVARLKTLVDGHSYTLLSPYPGLKTPIAASAWNHQITATQADDPRLKAFLDAYENGPQAPERGAACIGGTSEVQ